MSNNDTFFEARLFFYIIIYMAVRCVMLFREYNSACIYITSFVYKSILGAWVYQKLWTAYAYSTLLLSVCLLV